MGGLGEFAGSLMLTSTLRNVVSVVACPRRDAVLEIRYPARTDVGAGEPLSVPIAALRPFVAGEMSGLSDFCRGLCDRTEPAVSALAALLASGAASQLAPGFTIEYHALDTAAYVAGGVAALAAATLEAIAATASPAFDRATILACIERIAAWPSLCMAGLRSLMTSLIGHPRTLLQLRRHGHNTVSQLELPPGVCLAAIEAHPQRTIRVERAAESQFVSRMGHRMIQQLAKSDPTLATANGHLASISPTDYVDRIRDQLPSKITGRAFLQKYGPLEGDRAIEPNQIYKPRSRAEHHIYENQRVHDFAACLARARRNGDESQLIEAGELMFASHWSHSQRCGLGSVETDALTQLVRDNVKNGLFGAKLAGGWTDGLMVILMRDDETAHAALRNVADAAERRFKTPFAVLTGSDPGASISGAHPAAAD